VESGETVERVKGRWSSVEEKVEALKRTYRA